ncbi:hypothetical protein HCN44_002636 [Aphidius gifuensis]|uniref:Uncharacterized protein n=1 Tax=Aphidius gifuensis TaxID=684658 RepID=A0A834XTQ9_APHGI|nr:uncharacterized protein LOC122854558 [Aphidius gifuensis]KAF7991074.1 hypothetical protein HCN44_002636 [Aphidius gifuensis]
MASSGNSSSAGSALTKFGLRPVTKCNLVKFYIPAFGAASYTGLAINIMNPSIKTDITNVLLGGTLIGTGTYIYTRDHMKTASQTSRVIYSASGAVLFTFGSVLSWAVLQSATSGNSSLSTILGVGIGLAALKTGHSYLGFVDSQVAKK